MFFLSSCSHASEKDEDAADIVILCLVLVIITTIISTIFLLHIFRLYRKNAQCSGSFQFNSPVSPCNRLQQCRLYTWILGFKKRRIWHAGTGEHFQINLPAKAVSIGSGIISPSPAGLIVGTTVNDATIAVVLLKKTLVNIHFFKNTSFERLKKVAFRYKQFPQYNAEQTWQAHQLCSPLLFCLLSFSRRLLLVIMRWHI